MQDGTISDLELSSNIIKQLTHFSNSDDLADKVDFIVTLGGDGTLLHASSLFQVSLRVLSVNIQIVIVCENYLNFFYHCVTFVYRAVCLQFWHLIWAHLVS